MIIELGFALLGLDFYYLYHGIAHNDVCVQK